MAQPFPGPRASFPKVQGRASREIAPWAGFWPGHRNRLLVKTCAPSCYFNYICNIVTENAMGWNICALSGDLGTN